MVWFRLVPPGLVCLAVCSPAAAQEPAASAPAVPARNLTGSVAERNESNPRFAPGGRLLAFERRDGSSQALYVVDLAAGTPPVRISSAPVKAARSAEEALLGGGSVDSSFNTQLSFFPDGREVVFTGNGTEGTYRLYRGPWSGGPFVPITSDSKEDGHPAVSPDGRFLAFVSARAGVGKLYLRDLTTGVERPLTTGRQVDLYPAWSPDSKAIAFTAGDNDNHDVFLIPDVHAPAPVVVPLSSWKFDDLRPIFSPDGKHVAFYSNYNAMGEDREWSIVVVPADGTGATKGTALAERVVATGVVKDPELGPAWLPDSRRIIYARNLKAEFNPIYTADVQTREEKRVDTGTRMNHDLACAADGTLAFRAQVKSWDDVFVAAFPEARP